MVFICGCWRLRYIKFDAGAKFLDSICNIIHIPVGGRPYLAFTSAYPDGAFVASHRHVPGIWRNREQLDFEPVWQLDRLPYFSQVVGVFTFLWNAFTRCCASHLKSAEFLEVAFIARRQRHRCQTISLHTSLEFNNKQQDKLFFSTSLTALLYAAPEYRINAERS